jgi:hypothetical protein
MKEFRALDRNEDGTLVNMFDHFLLLTDKQVAMLAEDDHVRYNDYQEELNYELYALGA